MKLVLKNKEGMAIENFKKEFKKVSTYNFNNTQSIHSLEVKRQLIEKVKSFKRKYKNDEQVERFIKISNKIIRKGL